jgi:hypothetical protein
MKRWKVGDQVRLDAEFKSHLGRLAADTPGEVVKLELGRRVLLRTPAGDVWIDADRLLPAQRGLEERP